MLIHSHKRFPSFYSTLSNSNYVVLVLLVQDTLQVASNVTLILIVIATATITITRPGHNAINGIRFRCTFSRL